MIKIDGSANTSKIAEKPKFLDYDSQEIYDEQEYDVDN